MLRLGLRCTLYLLAALSPAVIFMSTVAPGPASAATLPSNCVSSGGTVSCTFAYNGTDGFDGSPQLFTAPAGITSLTIEAWGAQGGGSFGGLGGHAVGTLPVTPGTTLTVFVGGQPGQEGGSNGGGFNGGGVGAWGGGGASDVRVGGAGLGNRVLIAGGGGGTGLVDGTSAFSGGAGGGPAGGNGAASTGGTQTLGGTGSSSECQLPPLSVMPGGNGSTGLGGNGGVAICRGPIGTTVGAAGAGGGGGLFGGGGGGALVGCFGGCAGLGDSGGGGSGFVSPSATSVTNEVHVRAGNGLVIISYLGTPPNSAACKNGGWHNFVDDSGQPFPNQGQCVSWVLHHA